jgi:hypothetical protein
MCRCAGYAASSGNTIRSGSCSASTSHALSPSAGSPGAGYLPATAGSHRSRTAAANAAVSAQPTTYPPTVPSSSSTKASSGASST